MEALADSPVVLMHGPRQCGKTMLARQVGDEAGFAYLSFDDDIQRAAAIRLRWRALLPGVGQPGIVTTAKPWFSTMFAIRPESA